MIRQSILGVGLLLLPVLVAAQVPAQVERIAVDPARLTAAREVVDLAEPPATREKAFESTPSMVAAMVRRSVMENPQFHSAFTSDPRVGPIIDEYLVGVSSQVADVLKSGIPALYEAIAKSYARAFTLGQLADLKAFFRTPTGLAYATTQQSVLSDPDVLQARTEMYAKFNATGETQALIARLRALPPLKSTS